MVNYAIVGGGRLARHFSNYFRLLEIPHRCWARDRRPAFNTSNQADAETRLRETVAHADRVLLLVSDDAIAGLLKQYPFLHEKRLVHCSGSLSFPGIAGAHPLMTFADRLYDLDTYRSVPFMLEAGNTFADTLPGLANPHFTVGVEDKALYHALCVTAGNFAQVLWKGVSGRFEKRLGLSAESLHPYLAQVADNFVRAPETALTGPLSRDDRQTLARNINALEGDPLQGLYRAFVEFHQADTETTGQARLEQAV